MSRGISVIGTADVRSAMTKQNHIAAVGQAQADTKGH
jgi:hypothetical protein